MKAIISFGFSRGASFKVGLSFNDLIILHRKAIVSSFITLIKAALFVVLISHWFFTILIQFLLIVIILLIIQTIFLVIFIVSLLIC